MTGNRELDVSISELVFGIKVEALHQKYGHRIDYVGAHNCVNDPIIVMEMVDKWKLKEFSKDMNCAWEVVTQINKLYPRFSFSLRQANGWLVVFYANDVAYASSIDSPEEIAQGICFAALKVVKNERI